MRKFMLTAAILAMAGAAWATMTETGQILTGRWSYTEKAVVDRGTYFRLKVDVTYKGEPQHFDIVVGCNVLNIAYKDGNSTHEVGLIPTLYGRRMSDGKGLVIRAPDACDGETTANGEVPADFTPLIVVFEDAQTLQFGTAYLSDDAYEGPLSDMRFGKASVEAATRAEFDVFRREGPPNLIEPAQYKPWLDQTKTMRLMTTACYSIVRFRIPEDKRHKLAEFRPEGAPRFWTFAPGGKNPRSGIGYQRDDGGKIEMYIDAYMWDTLRDNGAPKRNGGRVIGRSARAVAYYPLSIPYHGVPDGHEPRSRPAPQAGIKPNNFVDAHIEDGRYRGFAYCFNSAPYLPSDAFAQRMDGAYVQNKYAGTQYSFDVLYENDQYFYLPLIILLDSTRGGV